MLPDSLLYCNIINPRQSIPRFIFKSTVFKKNFLQKLCLQAQNNIAFLIFRYCIQRNFLPIKKDFLQYKKERLQSFPKYDTIYDIVKKEPQKRKTAAQTKRR